MNKEQAIEQRLWDYIDGLCSPAEKTAIDNLVATDPDWQLKHQQLLGVHQMLQQSELEAPSLRFTKNVMEEISRNAVAPAARSYVNKNIIRSIGAFFLTIIVALLIYCFRQFTWKSSSESSIAIPDLGLDKVNYGKILNSTYTSAFILVAVICGLVLLDAWLRQKKQSAV